MPPEHRPSNLPPIRRYLVGVAIAATVADKKGAGAFPFDCATHEKYSN